MMQLNEGQALAAEKLKAWIGDSSNMGKHFVLSGGPGTGKTTFILEALKGFRYKIYGCAVAHAAKNQLYESLNHTYPCFTVAQMLGMRMDVDTNPGEVTFVVSKGAEKKITDPDILILDECSMISDDLYKLIIKECRRNNIFLIAMGDKRQCPPVGQDSDSKFFNKIDAELTETMRFGKEIQTLESIYREAIDELNEEEDMEDHFYDENILNVVTDREDVWNKSDKGFGFVETPKDMINLVVSSLKRSGGDIRFTRLLAYRNATVRAANGAIRRLLYGKADLGQFEHGEIVICNGGYSVTTPDGKQIQALYNGEVVMVEDFIEVEGPNGVPCLKMKFKDTSTPYDAPIYVVKNDEESQDIYHDELDELLSNARRDKKQWRKFWDFKSKFAEFDFAYAQNIYKAQGQTLSEVVVHVGDISATGPLTPKQRYQALYVACTRARNKVYLYTHKPKRQ